MDTHKLTGEPVLRWYFYEDQPGSWRWDKVSGTGEVLEQSSRSFASRAECVGDAKARGHGAGAELNRGASPASPIRDEQARCAL